VELAAKYDVFDPHRGVTDVHDTSQTTLGLNVYLHGNRQKIQINYALRRSAAGPQPPDEVVCQYQLFLW